MKQHTFLFILISIIVFLLNTVYADRISIVFDNDTFANKDAGYTSGTHIGWLGDELNNTDLNKSVNAYGRFMQNAVKSLAFVNLNNQKKHNAGISVYQMIYTPEDISSRDADYNDIPYSGSLLSSFFFFEWDSESYHEYSFDIGIIGPNSGAKWIQTTFHKLAGKKPNGWDHQLENKLMLGMSYGYGIKSWTKNYDNKLESDWVNTFRCQVGNFYTGVSGSTIWRYGKNYANNFNSNFPGTMGNSSLLGAPRRNKDLGWSFSTGLLADAIAYFHVIDSADKYNISRNKFSASLIASGSLYFDNVEIAFSMRRGTALIKEASSNTGTFGTIAILWSF